MNAMRETGEKGSEMQAARHSWTRALRLAVVLLGVGLVLGTGTARAQSGDDEGDDRSFERRLIDNLMSGLGAKRLGDSEIEYRERSPLVLPSNVNQLPPPETGKQALAPNWPKDPDEAERKAARAAAKQSSPTLAEQRRTLLPSELAQKAPRSKTAAKDTVIPGNSPTTAPLAMLPSQLGYNGGLFSTMFGGSNKTETATFSQEPEREDLTQPPAGYQTPSPNFAYGTGPAKAADVKCDAKTGFCEGRWGQDR
jgi:hypothetical protein